MMERQKFQTRKFLLRGESQREALIALAKNLPLDQEKPLEAVIREEVKPRKPDQNSAYWAGPLRDIAEQAWHNGRQYSAELWHEIYKRLYLPEDDDPEIETLARSGYRKWDFLPNGERVLVGSTTQLLVKGFAIYLTKVEADGASMGVIYHQSPNEVMA